MNKIWLVLATRPGAQALKTLLLNLSIIIAIPGCGSHAKGQPLREQPLGHPPRRIRPQAAQAPPGVAGLGHAADPDLGAGCLFT